MHTDNDSLCLFQASFVCLNSSPSFSFCIFPPYLSLFKLHFPFFSLCHLCLLFLSPECSCVMITLMFFYYHLILVFNYVFRIDDYIQDFLLNLLHQHTFLSITVLPIYIVSFSFLKRFFIYYV